MSRNAALAAVRQQIDFNPKTHNEILSELIKKITLIDFRDIAAIDEREKIKNQHYLIITIEEVLKIAKTNNWGICRNHDFIYVFNRAYWSLLDVEELKTFLGTAAEANPIFVYVLDNGELFLIGITK